jgi:hypothetical protein
MTTREQIDLVGKRLAEAAASPARVDLDEDLADRRAKVRGTMVNHALREGRLVARSNP